METIVKEYIMNQPAYVSLFKNSSSWMKDLKYRNIVDDYNVRKTQVVYPLYVFNNLSNFSVGETSLHFVSRVFVVL